MKIQKLVCLTVATLFVTTVEAAIMKMASGQLNFTAVGSPGILKIRGNAIDDAPKGQVEIKNGEANGDFTFNLTSLDTGIELRDKHMKNKYLEVEKFPNAKLKITGLKITDAEIQAGAKKDFVGQLTLHGETKEVKGQFEIEKTKKLKASFPITVSDFKIDIPRYMGVTVSETVEIEIESQLE